MTDPDRLLSGQGSELTRALLSAAREEAPNDAALQRTLTAVGAGATVLATSAAASGALGASASSAVAKLGSASSSLAITVKWLGIGAVGGVLGAGAVQQIEWRSHGRASSHEAARPLSPRAAEPQNARAPRTDHPAVSDDVFSVEATKSAPAVSARTPRAAQTSKPAPRPVEPSHESVLLTEEVAALDRAREAVSVRDPRRALLAIEAYERQFSERRLTPEALYLRMEAQLQNGDRRAASGTAQQILRVDPNGPHAARARAILAL